MWSEDGKLNWLSIFNILNGNPVYSSRGGWPQMTEAKVYRHSNPFFMFVGKTIWEFISIEIDLKWPLGWNDFRRKWLRLKKFWTRISFMFILNWTKFDFKNQLIWNGLIFFFKILKWATLRHLILKILRKHFETQTRLEK